jgi:hypothetical protein
MCNELEGKRKEAIVTEFDLLFWYLHGETRDYYGAPSECKTESLLFASTCWWLFQKLFNKVSFSMHVIGLERENNILYLYIVPSLWVLTWICGEDYTTDTW